MASPVGVSLDRQTVVARGQFDGRARRAHCQRYPGHAVHHTACPSPRRPRLEVLGIRFRLRRYYPL